MPPNIGKACCAAFVLALGAGPSSVAAQAGSADRPGAPEETREDRRYGKQLEAPSPLLFQLPGTGQAAPPQRLTYQYSYSGEAEATYRRDPDLDRRVRDNVSLVKPQLNGIIVYRPTDSLVATLEMILEREIPIREPSSVQLPNGTTQFAPQKRRWSLLVDQGFVTFRRPGQPFSLSVGRRNYEDDRHWLYDTSMDMVSAGYRQGRFRAEVSFGREIWTDLDLAPHIQQAKDRIDTYMLYADYRGIENHRLGAYGIARDDRAKREGRPVLTGVRLQGTPSESLSYWGELAAVRGKDEDSHRLKAHAFDVGGTYRFNSLPFKPNLTLGYAFGSGDGNPRDKTNTEFRQTGLQSNESRFAGVALFNIYGEAVAPELSNLRVATVGLGFRPDHATSLDFVFHRYRLHKIADENRSWGLTALMNQVPGQESKQVGQALDIVLGFRNLFGVRRLGLDLRMGWFFPGKAFNRDEGTEEQPSIRRANNAFALVAKFFY
jgi:alginate production protein